MENNANFRIAVYIAGTVERHSGFSQIASIGALAGMEDKNLDVFPISCGITNENPIITVKNTDSYVFYKLWDSSIYNSDDSNVGRFCIGMTIPAQARLADNKSPYTLLMGLYQRFLEMGTVPAEEGKRRFANVELDKAQLFGILQQYPIIPAAVKVEPMRGNVRGQLRLAASQMEDFFRDTQYHEFMNYDAVEVTTTGENMFPNLTIPHPKSYQIVINGHPENHFLQSGSGEEYVVRLDPNLDYGYESLRISLSQLMSANDKTIKTASGKTRVHLDENARCISCVLDPVQRWYYKYIKKAYDSDETAFRYFNDNIGSRIKICVGGRPWEEEKMQPSRVAIQHSDGRVELKKDIITIEPSVSGNYRFSVESARIEPDYSSPGREKLAVTVRAEKLQPKKEKTEGHEHNGGQTTSKKRSLFLVGFILGLLLGVAGVFAWQYFGDRISSNRTEKKLKQGERTAFDSLRQPPVTPEDAMKYRAFLNNYSEGFEYKVNEHVTTAHAALNKFTADSSAAREKEDEAYAQLAQSTTPADTALCDAYLSAYDPVTEHQFFSRGDYVEQVKEKRAELVEIQRDLDQKGAKEREKAERQAKESKIKDNVLKELIRFINSKEFSDYNTWKTQVNSEWKADFGETKKNVDILKMSGAQFWGDHILDIPRGPKGRQIKDYLESCDKYINGTFSVSDKAKLAQIAKDIDDYKKGKISELK